MSDDWLLMLIDNQNSFGVATDRPAYLKNIELTIGDQWRTALLGLDDVELREALGDVLDEQRFKALRDRRDVLIRAAMGEPQ